ncbi:hypothetical protein GTR02_04120 [Kineococcus sp. R8]|uniref:SRPBCC family protein n=1 Tax=Kineococcus siccus TaxID=2696567 RepID=UPI0014130281|nr:hypothetical protein [Kineococcus siccus]
MSELPAAEVAALAPPPAERTRAVVAFTARQLVDADAAAVFAVLTDWPRQTAWVPGTVVERLPGPVAAAGERFVGRSAVGPLVLDDPMTVVRFRAPAAGRPGVVDLVKTGAVLGGTVTIGIRDVGGGRTQVEWTERIRVRPAWLAALAAVAGPVPRWLGSAAFTAVLRAMVREAFPAGEVGGAGGGDAGRPRP